MEVNVSKNNKSKNSKFQLINNEFGCCCNRDENCQYENTCKQMMLEV